MRDFLKILAVPLALLSFQARAADDSQSVDCVFEAPMATKLIDGDFSRVPVKFNDMTTPWEYTFVLGPSVPGEAVDVEIESARDFATIRGSTKGLKVAPDTYVVMVIKPGSCMFSSALCGAFIQLTDLDSDQAAASINPISYIGDQKDTEFFHVDIVGKCKKASEGEEPK